MDQRSRPSAPGSADDRKKSKQNVSKKDMASLFDTLQFVWGGGQRVRIIFVLGFIGGALNGLVYPMLAYLLSKSFADIGGAQTDGLEKIRQLAYTFMFVGAYALVCGTIQAWCFEIVAYEGTKAFRLQWFHALLRQDAAYFDVYEVGGIAAQVGPNANKYRRGMGRKFGEGIQFFTTAVGGLAFALYSNWRVALVVLSVIPLVSFTAFTTMRLNQNKGTRAARSYKRAGSVAYSTVSAIKTVLSLNAIREMTRQYNEATAEAYRIATRVLIPQGISNGAMMGTFLINYAILTLYGGSLLYRDVAATGCDPSSGVSTNRTCDNSGPGVFGAMLGVAFAAQGVSQFSSFGEAFSIARVATFEALKVIRRHVGHPGEIIYKEVREEEPIESTSHSRSTRNNGNGADIEAGGSEGREIKAILPTYEIDSLSEGGLKPKDIQGAISIQDVVFSYPTRPSETILNGLTTEIQPGKIVAFVGPSGGGKSTVVSMIERFYDPKGGKILLDGVDLKDYNISYLRSLIGYVGQEPTLFATTIRGNIQYGNPAATNEQIEEAAKMANAHDFIMSFTDGYDTQCGDKGSQLSGGQKQRIAIARVLVGNPKILLLDEATSALDAESELVVQDALDSILAKKKITTIIIAHRLSTIRNADVINVIVKGQVVESGKHEELMAKESYYRGLVLKQEGGGEEAEKGSPSSSRTSSCLDLAKMAEAADEQIHKTGGTAHLEFKDVVFAYPARPKKKVLKKFNLIIKRGETVALVGPSGGGKSTTIGLIERFYDPLEGCLEYLGHDVRSLNIGWYRDQIGYVGQEPTLFNDTIANNIALGLPGATRAQIEEAAKQANAHEFIMEFPDNYDTPLGEKSQLSGGQKQRIAIARALVKKPKVLLLDEATSALDNESEAIVQAAIDKLMESRQHTVVIIAHRLSTVRNADHIALIADGKVIEYGSHDELISKPHGRYRRLSDSSKRSATIETAGLINSALFIKKDEDEEEDEEKAVDWDAQFEEEGKMAFDANRARQWAKPEAFYLLVGSIGALMAGGVFPMWGLLYAQTIDLVFQRVLPCSDIDPTVGVPDSFANCHAYWESVKHDMRDKSFKVAEYWAIECVGCLFGNVLLYWGFGVASERINKRVRDVAFSTLLKQEVGFFDKRSVGSITSQLQDDAARIHSLTGEPLRSFIMAMASVVIGLTLSFVYMWQFALLAIGCVPLMAFAASKTMKRVLGENLGDTDASADNLNTPGGVIVESLLNIRTVAALTLEKRRYADYERALLTSEPDFQLEAFTGGVTGGLSMFIQQWVNALLFWFGGYLLFHFPEDYEFKDFLVANFAVLFALFGLGAAFQDMSDRKEVEISIGRLFHLLDRKSEIDPLSTEGKKLE